MLAFSGDAFVKSQCLNSRRLYVYCGLQIMAHILFFVVFASREDWESVSLLLNPATVRPTLACIFQRYFDGFPF